MEDRVKAVDTMFQLKENIPGIRKIFRTLIVLTISLTIIAGVFLPPIVFYGRKQEALAILGKAKNVEFTLRLLALEYYGEGKDIFTPQKASGMTDEGEAELKKMSMMDGKLYLLEWSYKEMRPIAFLYVEEPYTVSFTYNLTEKDNLWQVYRSKEVLEFGK